MSLIWLSCIFDCGITFFSVILSFKRAKYLRTSSSSRRVARSSRRANDSSGMVGMPLENSMNCSSVKEKENGFDVKIYCTVCGTIEDLIVYVNVGPILISYGIPSKRLNIIGLGLGLRNLESLISFQVYENGR